MTDDVLREQIAYYRARAPEYDATSRPPGDPFAALADEAVADLQRLGPVDLAIELGAGTGQWTRHVAALARDVVAVDAAPETLELNRANVPAPNIRRIVADVFDFVPERRADLVVFSALLSHIPSARFEAFWASVGRALAPGGRVWLFDESPHGLWREEWVVDPEHEIVERTLEDGRSFRIVKVLWDASDLEQALASIGWQASLTRRDPFYWGRVTRAGG